MLQTEFLRSLNCNYERILLNTNPEERKFQCCMLCRGGIKGLLSCSLRYINGLAYLYYDISSKQNITRISSKRPLSRQWVKDFLWSMRQVREELSRFLLDECNVLWFPQQIYQDLESNEFVFLYVPYYEQDNGFNKLLEFLIERIDYEDECLVECVYKMYEQFEKRGWDYLQRQIYLDAQILEEMIEPMDESGETYYVEKKEINHREIEGKAYEAVDEESRADKQGEIQRKKGLGAVFKNKWKKEKELREDYRSAMQLQMEGRAVAEEIVYDQEEWGKTIYIEEAQSKVTTVHSLFTQEGRLLAKLEGDALTIGKKKDEVDVVLEDISVSRMHARVVKVNGEIYLEDLNSTNGTFKNGLRLEPYEKRRLEIGDEIRVGKKELIYR